VPVPVAVFNPLTSDVEMRLPRDPLRVIGRRIRRIEDPPFGLIFPGLFPALLLACRRLDPTGTALHLYNSAFAVCFGAVCTVLVRVDDRNRFIDVIARLLDPGRGPVRCVRCGRSAV
jgi:hypothetical protein